MRNINGLIPLKKENTSGRKELESMHHRVHLLQLTALWKIVQPV